MIRQILRKLVNALLELFGRKHRRYTFFNYAHWANEEYVAMRKQAVIRLAPSSVPATPETYEKVAQQLNQAGLPLIQPEALNLEQGFAVVYLTRKVNTKAQNLGVPLVTAWCPVLEDSEGCEHYYLPDEVLICTDATPGKEDLLDGLGLGGKEKAYTSAVRIGAGSYQRITKPGLFEELASGKFVPPIPPDNGSDSGKPTDIPLLHRIEVGIDLIEDAAGCLATQTQPSQGLLWHMRNVGQEVEGELGIPGADSKAWAAQDYIKNHGMKGEPKQVVVAIIDTGVDVEHPSLKGNMLPRNDEDWNFASPFSKEPTDVYGHGTHCAGIVAANLMGSGGILGAAPEVLIMPIKIDLVLSRYEARAEAITYVADYAQRPENQDKRFIINCSWKTGRRNVDTVRMACQYAAAQPNVLLLFSAGNGNRCLDRDPQYPAAYPEVFTVAATDSCDQKSKISNWGEVVDICAPGQSIYSTFTRQLKPQLPYCFLDGTSMATPLVAGCAALVWSKAQHLSPAELREIMATTGTDITDRLKPKFQDKMGRRVNALEAVKEAQARQYAGATAGSLEGGA